MADNNFKYGDQINHDDSYLVTAILVDNFKQTAKFVIEKGIDVDTIEVTMELAQEIGLINVQKLSLIYKKQSP